MSSFHIRPRFTHTVDFSPEEIRARLERTAARPRSGIELKSFPNYIGLHIPEEQQQFWSPRLALSLEPEADNRTVIQGTYGPNANVWSLYLYCYLIVGLLGTFSGILGFAQRVIGSPPWGLWVCGVMIALGVILYLVAQLGQKLASWQTFQLHLAYQTALGTPSELY